MIYNKQIIRGKIPSKSNCYKVITIRGHGSLAKQPALNEYEKSVSYTHLRAHET